MKDFVIGFVIGFVTVAACMIIRTWLLRRATRELDRREAKGAMELAKLASEKPVDRVIDTGYR